MKCVSHLRQPASGAKETFYLLSALVAISGSAASGAADVQGNGMSDRSVRVDGGLISGVPPTADGVRVFKGIPYAAPPVGDLRWRTPQAVVPWKGVRRANDFAASCMQPPLRETDIYRETQVHPSSEDCLYLNVWTSARSPDERRPVLLFVHPSGLIAGEGSIPAYDGESLSKKGLVVVTINYRLGIFGTLAHPELSRESANKVSGNYALLDMVAAIKWARRNIAAFGGDPARITLFGESAGGRAVSALSTSPLVRGDIHGVIAGDTIYAQLWGGGAKLADAEGAGADFATASGAGSIGDLRRIPADELIVAASKYQYRQIEFVEDDCVLSGDVFAAQKSGTQHNIPILTGITADFSSAFFRPLPAQEFIENSRKQFGELADRFLALYPASSDAEAADSQRAYVTDLTAWIHTAWAAALTRAGNRAYLYLFTRTVPPPRNARTLFMSDAVRPERLGAWHTGEIAYAFDTLAKLDRPWTPTDHHLADIMSSYWENFVAKGDPNGVGLPRWPVYGDSDKPLLQLGDRVEAIAPVLSAEESRFWSDYLASRGVFDHDPNAH